jgi:hypothetical protein
VPVGRELFVVHERRLLEGDTAALAAMSLDTVTDDLRPYLLPAARVELGERLRGIASVCSANSPAGVGALSISSSSIKPIVNSLS